MDNINKQVFLLLIEQIRQNGVQFSPRLRREIENKAMTVGIPFDVATKFVELIICELLHELIEGNLPNSTSMDGSQVPEERQSEFPSRKPLNG